MKIKPQPGIALLQIVKEDFVNNSGIIEPFVEKETSFFNRMRILDLGKTDSKFIRDYKKGDVVVISVAGAQIAVPGHQRNNKGEWIDIILVPQNQIIAIIEGDKAEDWGKGRSKPMIVPPTSVN